MPAMHVQTSISTNPAKGYVGQLDTSHPTEIITAINGEASASIPFGYGVVWDPSAPVSSAHVTLPAAETNKVAGIVIFRQGYQPAWTDHNGVVHGDLDSVGLRPGTWMGILRKGRILVTAEDAVTRGDRLWVRCTAGGPGEVVGGLTNADEGTETIDATGQGMWDDTVSAGELCWLTVNFAAKP